MTVCIEVALKAEATPLIEAFKLKPLSGNPLFPIYENDEIKLIISGVGKIKAGAACSYLAGIHRDEDIYGWINVGIGGHRTLSVGTPALINKITDDARKTQHFPSIVFEPPCQTYGCITVENPENIYPTGNIYDMEAAGFYAIASKISPIEMVHVFKVISDNALNPAANINKNSVYALIDGHVELISTVIHEMHSMIEEIAPDDIPFLDECIKRWHFTTFETLQLKKLLQRWQLICPDQILFSKALLEKKTSKEVIAYLSSHIESTPIKL